MHPKKIHSHVMLGLSAMALSTTLVLVACNTGSTSGVNPALNVDSTNNVKQAAKPATSKPKTRVEPPNGEPIKARLATLLGDKRIKGQIEDLKDSELDTTISDYHFELGTDTDQDGAANEHAEGHIEIEGQGKNKVVIEQENYPVMSNEYDTLTVKDETTGNQRIYKADQDLFNYTVSDGTHELSINALPDGTWTVNGEAAVTPAAVAELAMKSPIIAEASAHGLMLMYQTFNQINKVPVEYLETLAPIHVTTTTPYGMNAGPSFGDPRPLMKEVLKLKLKQTP